jgi:hypothetical protein
MTPSEFLELLWGADPPGVIGLWRLSDKRSFYLHSPAGSTELAAGQSDVYAAVALTHKDHGAHKRATSRQTQAIAGLWLDLDVDGGPENKAGAIATVDAALELAHRIAQPTLIVASGYGLHAWWLFDEPYRFAGFPDQDQAQRMSAQWYALHRTLCAQHGWGLDHTHDLARLLRLPGTVNAKGGRTAPVDVIEHEGNRYQRHELAELCARAGDVPEAKLASPQADIPIGDPLDRDAFSTLHASNSAFAAVWAHERNGHWSLSEYDLALCGHAAHAGWADEQLAALIAEHRAAHDPADRKAWRPDYVQRTILRARTQPEQPPAVELQFVAPAELRLLAPLEPDWIWQGYLAPKTLTLLAGKPKLGKSTLACAIAQAVDLGADQFLGKPVRGGRVVYLSEESAGTLAPKLPAGALRILTRDLAWPRPQWPALITAAVTEAERVEGVLLVVDTFSFWGTLPAEREKDAGAMQAAMEPLLLATRNGLAVLLVHHTRKGGGQDGEAVRGSSALAGAVDIVLELERDENAPPGQREVKAGSRYLRTPGALVVDYAKTTGSWSVIGESADRDGGRDVANRRAILTALDAGTLSREEISEQTDLDWRQLSGPLAELITAHLVARTGAGKRGNPYRYTKLSNETVQDPGQQRTETSSTDLSFYSVPPVGGGIEKTESATETVPGQQTSWIDPLPGETYEQWEARTEATTHGEAA